MGERRVVVIGAGIGGLSAAIALAAAGWRVEVLEAAPEPGGKAGTVVLDGLRLDTGPSVLTLPDVFEDLFRLAGSSLAAEVELVRPDPSFRYVWPDGAVFDVFVEPERTVASARGAFGAAAEAELAAFLAYARRIWEASEHRFVRGDAPSVAAVLSPAAVRDVLRIDPLRTMAGGVAAHVREPHLRDVLHRYATYAGSDPRAAPATLNCIAHVELALGGFGVRGGIGALVDALLRAATRLGVEVTCGRPVRGLVVRDGRAAGVVTDAGERAADAVVSNAEVAHLHALLGRPAPPAPTSTSGWNALVRVPRAPRAGHTVYFPADYASEFVDLFDRRRVPADPALYACAPVPAHRCPGWEGAEPLFLMVNAPPDPASVPDGGEALARASIERLRAAGTGPAEVLWSRTPAGLAERFPGSRGALYGPAHDGMWAAFRRPAQRVPGVRGLYVASGSAHPGGGLPLAALSGRAAARALLADG